MKLLIITLLVLSMLIPGAVHSHMFYGPLNQQACISWIAGPHYHYRCGYFPLVARNFLYPVHAYPNHYLTRKKYDHDVICYVIKGPTLSSYQAASRCFTK